MKLRKVRTDMTSPFGQFESEGINVSTPQAAAQAAFAGGAKEAFRMVREAMKNGSLKDLMERAQTKSFYSENVTPN